MPIEGEELETGKITFRSDSRLLLELGERLVSSRDVAITELIKNAYDADSSECRVWHDQEDKIETLHVLDLGHGMTLEDFKKNWMTIATGFKAQERYSQLYNRIMTGAKGVGRFAVRFLGESLVLETIADDTNKNCRTRLTATFNWPDFASGLDLTKVEVPYRVEKVPDDAQLGTHLRIRDLRGSWEEDVMKKVRKEVIAITSPIQGLDAGDFAKKVKGEDPGFEVYFLPPEEEEEMRGGESSKVLDYGWARLQIDLKGKKIEYIIDFRDGAPGWNYTHKLKNSYIEKLRADIRFFPVRQGVFIIPDMNGNVARRWVRENSGIAVIDHGFRMRPYGYPDDDWLWLSSDAVSARRRWRGSITEENFPSEKVTREEKLDPALNLPRNHQLVGAVFLESQQSETIENKDPIEVDILIPAMDRQGYIENAAFSQLQDILRSGLEFLAIIDKRDQLRREELEFQEEKIKFQKGIDKAVKDIETSTDIPAVAKKRLIRTYKRIGKDYDTIEKYHERARGNLEFMGLLGVVAGFMTHESHRIFRDIELILKKIKELGSEFGDNKELMEIVNETEESIEAFSGYIEYTGAFISGIHAGKVQRFKAAPQIDRIISKFGNFADTRGIKVEKNVDSNLYTAPTLVTLYSGVLLNLYTNALKAVLRRTESGEPRRIFFKAWNEPGWHIVQVIDNGAGIPKATADLIWDPLFSTTTSGEGPLGSGMGLGLSIIKRLMEEIDGEVDLVEAPEGFITCFEVRFRNEEE